MLAFKFIFALVFIYRVPSTWSCREALCGSIVSKCLLTQSCKCELKNCTCCKDCSICLGELYTDCCSCVEMCPKTNSSNDHLARNSHIEDLEPIQDLFIALTEEPDAQERWIAFTFAAHAGISFFNELKHTTGETEKLKEEFLEINCTVAYLSQCMSWNKCKSSCTSMGSSSYRWFHDGCCECVGKNCLNYGINDSRCKQCPIKSVEEQVKDYEDTPDEDFVKGETSDKSATVLVTSKKHSKVEG